MDNRYTDDLVRNEDPDDDELFEREVLQGEDGLFSVHYLLTESFRS